MGLPVAIALWQFKWSTCESQQIMHCVPFKTIIILIWLIGHFDPSLFEQFIISVAGDGINAIIYY